jgi:hypothetical protein
MVICTETGHHQNKDLSREIPEKSSWLYRVSTVSLEHRDDREQEQGL